MRVHFRVIDAEAGAQNNNKEADDAKRIFILDQDNPWEIKDNELNIYFYYRASTQDDWTAGALEKATAAAKKKPPTLDHLKQIAEQSLLALNGGVDAEWRELLEVKYKKTDGELADYSVLMSQLNLYTKKNTFDYFIHKNLGEFLTRELDFYIKNELFRWEDISNMKSNPARMAPLLSKIEVIRTIGEKIIAFLAQLEDFQKKLWLKKKFVTETNYCITLDRLAEQPDLLAEIIVNGAQRQQWQELVDLDLKQLDQDVEAGDWITQDKYRYLMVDTGLFDEVFKAHLLAQFDDLDEQCDGVIINSDNFQALELMQERYKERVKSIYIDPPYNTGDDGFVYKDRFQHSSWLSMQFDRMFLAKKMLKDSSGTAWVNLDDGEIYNYKLIQDNIFGVENFIGNIAWKKTSGDNKPIFAYTHDNLIIYGKNGGEPERAVLTGKQRKQYKNPDNDIRGDWAASDYRSKWKKEERRNLYYGIQQPNTGIIIYPDTFASTDRVWASTEDTHKQNVEDGLLWWGEDGLSNEPKKKRFLNEHNGINIRSVWDDAGTNDGASQELKDLLVSIPPRLMPKPHALVKKISRYAIKGNDLILDYFAGSGTTAHATISLNREDQGKRKYILVEMGVYFDTILKPRIQKVVYSQNWKAGKPEANESGSFNGVPHCFKYLRLESYEDTLANLQLKRTPVQDDLLSSNSADEQSAREAYLLNYMLDVETQGSASLLDISQFVDPTAYQLKVRNPTGDETKLINVDLLETFNWLLGLTVEHISAPIHFNAELKQAEYGRWQANVKRQTDGKWWFRTVAGTNRKGQKILIVWRNLSSVIANEANGLVMDNAVLDAVLIDKLSVRMTESQDDEFDMLYVNGDHNITIPKNRQGGLMESRVKLIEEDFHRLMFSSVEH